MQILSRATWGAAPPKRRTPIGVVVGWIVHWVGAPKMFSSPTLQQSLALMLSLQNAAMRGLHGDVYVDFEYNFAVDPAGRIFEGRGWDTESGANGTNDANAHYWSVVYLAGPGVPLTDAAKQAFLWLTQEGTRRRPNVLTVRPHDEVPGDSTGCPGPDLTPFSHVLNAELHAPAPVPAPPAQKVKPMYDPPLDIASPIVASLDAPGGGAWALSLNGRVHNFGSAKLHGDAYGQPYFAGRTAAQLVASGNGYAIVAGTGERYDYPAT